MANSLLACPQQGVFVVVLADRAPGQWEVVIRPFWQTQESDIVNLILYLWLCKWPCLVKYEMGV